MGQRCPVCGQGNLYALPAGVEVRIDGHALLSAMRYTLEKLRCAACGARWDEDRTSGRYRARSDRASIVVRQT